jgi:hypothetical protein
MAPALGQHQGLGETGDADGAGEHVRGEGRLTVLQQQHQHRRDQDDIEQQRRKGAELEAMLGVEHAHHHRHRADKGEIGQHQAGVVHGTGQGVGDEARSQEPHDLRHEQRKRRGNDDQDQADRAHGPSGKSRGCHRPVAVAGAEIERDQRRVQCAFGKGASRHIDELERHQEGIRDRAGPEQRRDQRVADEAEQARGHRAGGDREDVADHEAKLWAAGFNAA